MKNIVIASSPHLRSTENLTRIMYDVVIALVQPCWPAPYFFVSSFVGYALCCGQRGSYRSRLFENRRQKKYWQTAFDGSAIVAGLLLAFNLPPTIPLWIVIIGSIVTIAVAKHTFGGLGYNLFNPALVGRIFLLISFPVQMTAWSQPTYWKTDVVSGATPLGMLKTQGLSAVQEMFSTQGNFIGAIPGCLGEVSAAALILGAIYLLMRKVITWQTPVFFLGTLVFTSIFYLVDPTVYADPVFHLVSGGVILGACFMATDMVTSPLTRKGQAVFGIGCGLITGLIRLFGGYPEGVAFAILLMNAMVPLIDRFTEVKKFGA